MAVDPERYQNLRNAIRKATEFAPTSEENREEIEEAIVTHLLGEDKALFEDSRPPRLYIFGRSGAGKSSLINALAKKKVADIGAVEPETVESEKYLIQFPERHANWDVVDSRGLFETVPADGDIPGGTVEAIQKDLETYRPDIVLHVMTPDQVRAGKQDFDAVNELENRLPGGLPPVVYCLNKVDTHMAPTDAWPPEENEALAGDIVENLEFIASYLQQESPTPYHTADPFQGYTFDSTEYVGVFPSCARAGSEWNINTLLDLIGGYLPDEALLQFAQAQRRERVMQTIAREQTNKVAGTAGTIAGVDFSGISDMMVLTPMQVYLVMIIGALSCQEFSVDRAREYFTELGVISSAGLGARKLAGALTGTLGVPGAAINASVAATTTYMIGRSAESFFFDDELMKPKEFREDGKELFSETVL